MLQFAFTVMLISAVGLEPEISVGDDCAQALHSLRESGMQIVSTQAVDVDDGEILVHTLIEDRPIAQWVKQNRKTATLHCGYQQQQEL